MCSIVCGPVEGVEWDVVDAASDVTDKVINAVILLWVKGEERQGRPQCYERCAAGAGRRAVCTAGRPRAALHDCSVAAAPRVVVDDRSNAKPYYASVGEVGAVCDVTRRLSGGAGGGSGVRHGPPCISRKLAESPTEGVDGPFVRHSTHLRILQPVGALFSCKNIFARQKSATTEVPRVTNVVPGLGVE